MARSKSRPPPIKEPDKYSDLVEAYNYCIGYFCNPIDFSRKRDFGTSVAVIPFNKNDFLELFFNRIPTVVDVRQSEQTGSIQFVYRSPRGEEMGEFYKPKYCGKWWYEKHLSREETLYYRSKYNCIARIGYHSYERAHKKFPWAAQFGIDGKSRKFPLVGWMLLGFDLDAKHGEPDLNDLLQWLLEYFPQSYHEPSTSGNGAHLFVKLAYPVNVCATQYETLRLVDDVITRLSTQLRRRAILRFKAQFDGIRSLPTLLSFDEKKGRIVVAKRYECIKAPRCLNGMRDLLEFHLAPFALFEGVRNILRRMESERILPPQSMFAVAQTSTGSGDLQDDGPVVDFAGTRQASDSAITVEGIVTSETKQTSLASEKASLSPLLPSSLYKKCTPSGHTTFKVEEVRSIANTLMRKILLVMWESRRLKGIQPVTHYLDRYEALGLAQDSSRDQKRIRDMSAAVSLVAKDFDPAKGFALAGFDAERDGIIQTINSRLTAAVDLRWQKEANRVRTVGVEYLAAVYFALTRAAQRGVCHASEGQLIDQCRQIIRRRPHRNMMSAILRALTVMRLIEKIADPVFGAGRFNRGSEWRILP